MRNRLTILDTLTAINVIVLTFYFLSTSTPAFAQSGTVRIDITPAHAINSFDPDMALGSSIDVLSRAEIDRVYTPHILEESLSAG